MRHVIERKRDGGSIEAAQWHELIDAYMGGAVSDAQMSAFAMACVWRGLSLDEAAALTQAMVSSGETLAFPDAAHVVDKHSSGGVSDIVSLVAVPIVASCGVKVAKLSGRALGHTGGTIDKLETLDGFSAALSMSAFVEQVERIGCAIAAQSEALVPADKRLYVLRDITGTVACTGLIAASIVSKKVAGGGGAFVFDVKCGAAAFMKNVSEAQALAEMLVAIARRFGRRARAIVTDMNEPLGRFIGTRLELLEARDVLATGSGDERAVDMCVEVACDMLELAGVSDPHERARKALTSGDAYEAFERMVVAQGARPGALAELSRAVPSQTIRCAESGFVQSIDAVSLGYLAREINATDPDGGIQMHVRRGSQVREGDELASVYGAFDAGERVRRAIAIDARAPETGALIYARV